MEPTIFTLIGQFLLFYVIIKAILIIAKHSPEAHESKKISSIFTIDKWH